MACYHPIPASQDGRGARVQLWPPLGASNTALPCGKCIGCRTDRATHWANRCTHEASLWKSNIFITLTYDDEHLPEDGHLQPTDLQRFIKRLRKYATSSGNCLTRDHNANTRYFACGEYGSKTGRPHYHALIFNARFTDAHSVGKDLSTSETLSNLWRNGTHGIGECTPASAAYIAQYNLKKQGRGDYVPDTGEWRPPPFLRMSLRPAIGAEWLKKYAQDLQNGYVVENGRKHPVPRYYRDKLKETHPELSEQMDAKIQLSRYLLTDSKTPERLRDSEIIHQRRKQLSEERKF